MYDDCTETTLFLDSALSLRGGIRLDRDYRSVINKRINASYFNTIADSGGSVRANAGFRTVEIIQFYATFLFKIILNLLMHSQVRL